MECQLLPNATFSTADSATGIVPAPLVDSTLIKLDDAVTYGLHGTSFVVKKGSS